MEFERKGLYKYILIYDYTELKLSPTHTIEYMKLLNLYVGVCVQHFDSTWTLKYP